MRCYSLGRAWARSSSASLSTDLWSTPRKDQAVSHFLALLPCDLLNLLRETRIRNKRSVCWFLHPMCWSQFHRGFALERTRQKATGGVPPPLPSIQGHLESASHLV